jgi:uncharacterized protein (DUF433 family)
VDRARGGATAKTDVRSQPAYSITEAARYLRLPPGTLRSWIVGRSYPTRGGAGTFRPLLKAARKDPATLSFWNLIEAHVLRALRTEHGVPVPSLRKAIHYAENALSIENVLLHPGLATDAGRVLLDRYGELLDLSNSGQLAMRRMLEAHLRRVEWDSSQFPARLFPFLSPDASGDERLIAIDPNISFGRPVVRSAGVSTQAITDRIDAGESIEDLAADYGVSQAEVEQAVFYHRAAA